MSEGDKTANLQRNIAAMLEILSIDRDDPDLTYGWGQLAVLERRLAGLFTDDASATLESAQMDFLALLETHPKLRKAYLVACHKEMVDILLSRIQYFVGLSRQRSLTHREERQKRRLEAELPKAQEMLHEALGELG